MTGRRVRRRAREAYRVSITGYYNILQGIKPETTDVLVRPCGVSAEEEKEGYDGMNMQKRKVLSLE